MTPKEKQLFDEVERLKLQIKKLKTQKKYGLVWDEEKEPEKAVLECEQKFPVLKEIKTKAINTDKNKPVNILIEGDNYHSLFVLNYTHKSKIDVIYIDPPYNTGAKDWKYNNSFVDENDGWRHSKWVNFMNKRLVLAKNLLKDDGVICVTIDDYELPTLWLLMHEIYGEKNHLGTVVIRNNPKGRMTKRKFSLVHEYALFYGKSSESKIKKIPEDPKEKTHNYKIDKNGEWYLPVNLRKQGVDSNAYNKKGRLSERFFPIYYDSMSGIISSTEKYKIVIMPIDSKGEKRIWRRSKDVIDKMYKTGDLFIKKTKQGHQVYFKFRGGLDGRLPQSIWYDSKFSASEHGTRTLDNILGKRELFQYPKSPFAIKETILTSSQNKNAIILDFFAGSGTTAHATLELNKQDNGNRKFILCTNNENNICTNVCHPRITKVIKGYTNNKNQQIKGLGSNLKYYKTDLIDINNPPTHKASAGKPTTQITDQHKIKLTYQAGEMIAIRENTYEEQEKNKHWQIFTNLNKTKHTAIYFQENKTQLPKLIKKLLKTNQETALYIFTWGKNEYTSEFSNCKNISVYDIPEPLIEVYKELNKL